MESCVRQAGKTKRALGVTCREINKNIDAANGCYGNREAEALHEAPAAMNSIVVDICCLAS
jgi:hypothetical protein